MYEKGIKENRKSPMETTHLFQKVWLSENVLKLTSWRLILTCSLCLLFRQLFLNIYFSQLSFTNFFYFFDGLKILIYKSGFICVPTTYAKLKQVYLFILCSLVLCTTYLEIDIKDRLEEYSQSILFYNMATSNLHQK